jgi:hypothetical protein
MEDPPNIFLSLHHCPFVFLWYVCSCDQSEGRQHMMIKFTQLRRGALSIVCTVELIEDVMPVELNVFRGVRRSLSVNKRRFLRGKMERVIQMMRIPL